MRKRKNVGRFLNQSEFTAMIGTVSTCPSPFVNMHIFFYIFSELWFEMLYLWDRAIKWELFNWDIPARMWRRNEHLPNYCCIFRWVVREWIKNRINDWCFMCMQISGWKQRLVYYLSIFFTTMMTITQHWKSFRDSTVKLVMLGI